MAADKATLNISASMLPDEIKASLSGTTNYDINDIGSANGWFYTLTLIGTGAEALIKASAPYMGGAVGEGATAIVAADPVMLVLVKHTGTTNGTVKTTNSLVLNMSITPTGTARGDIVLKPNECWYARMPNVACLDVDELLGKNMNEDSGGSTIQVIVMGIADNSG